MIQTSYKDDRGEVVTLTPHDAKYWEGPYVYIPYPKMLFRVTTPGQVEPEVTVVQSDAEHRALGLQWCETPDAAKSAFGALEADVARAAAESAAADSRLSASAQAERLAYERSTDEMVVDVPAPKKRGRPKKIVVAETE